MSTRITKARIKNTSNGPRYFQASGANVSLKPGETSRTLEFTDSEAQNLRSRLEARELAVFPEGVTQRAEPVPVAEGGAFAGKPLAEGADTDRASNPPAEDFAQRAADAATEQFFTPDDGGGDNGGDDGGAGGEGEGADKPDAIVHAGGGWYYGTKGEGGDQAERISEPMKREAAEAYAKEHGLEMPAPASAS